MTHPPLFTWADVNFLRREAGRHERWAKRGDGSAGSTEKARQLRLLADKIERSLKERAA